MRLYATCWLVLACTQSWAAPEGQRTSQSAAPVEGKASSQPDGDKRGSQQIPIFVQLVENQDDSARAKERETKTDTHDAEDLDAQIRTAQAAERQVYVAWAAILLSAVGTIVLLCSLRLTRQSVKAAVESSNIARQAFEDHERPWLVPRFFGTPSDEWKTLYKLGPQDGVKHATISFDASIVNEGKSPAIFLEATITLHDDSQIGGRIVNAYEVIGPGESLDLSHLSIPTSLLAVATHENGAQKTMNLPWLEGSILYATLRGREKRVHFAFEPGHTAMPCKAKPKGGVEKNYDEDVSS